MRGLLLFAGIFYSVTGCRPDYKTDWFGNCYKTYSSPVNRFQALRTCQRDGATLFPIASPADADAFTFISNTLGAMVWIGATCVTEEGTSCFTDEGTPLSYTNFESSPPNNYGPCVLFHTYTKVWYSSPCSDARASFVCKYTENPYIQYCEPGKWLFNGKCYWSLPPLLPFADAECQSQDGFMVSVHSIGENNFIHDVIHNSYGRTQDFYRIGLTNASEENPFWRDGTPYDYNNFGLILDDPCAAVSISGKVVASGKWFSDSCNISLPTVCKKNASRTYVPPKPRESALCGNNFLSPEGMVVSPNYPSSYSMDSCSNVLIWDRKANPNFYFSFVETYLGPDDYIKVYRTSTATFPTWTIRSGTQPGLVSVDNSGWLRFEFSGNNTLKRNYRWKLTTSFTRISSIYKGPRSDQRICDDFSPSDPGSGEFSSSNYGGYMYYPPQCRTIFKARDPSNTMVLTFFSFYLDPFDSVTLYDGYGENNTSQTYYGVNPGLSYESTGQYVTMVINQSNRDNFRGIFGEYHSN